MADEKPEASAANESVRATRESKTQPAGNPPQATKSGVQPGKRLNVHFIRPGGASSALSEQTVTIEHDDTAGDVLRKAQLPADKSYVLLKPDGSGFGFNELVYESITPDVTSLKTTKL